MSNAFINLVKELKVFGVKTVYYHIVLIMLARKYGVVKEKYKTLYLAEYDRLYSKLVVNRLKNELERKYKKAMNRRLNYEDPKAFTEKIQWMKIYDSTSLKTKLADKYAVREWISDKIGSEYLVPLLGVWERFEDIDFSALPNSFCLKTNHGSGMNLIVKNKSRMNVEEARQLFQWWIQRPFWIDSLELHYRDISRRIIAEKYIEEMNGGLYDYKIHCFHGEPIFIQCIGDRDLSTHTGYQMNYDPDWNAMDWIFEDYPAFLYQVPKPECLSEMLSIAKVLSANFSYVRVDLYEILGKVYFGEMTFTPARGLYPYKGTWTREKDLELGKRLILSV